MKRFLTVATVQHSNNSDYNANLAKSMAGIREAAAKGAQLVLLQELHTGLYFCQEENADYFDLAETIPGPTTETLGQLAAELNIVIVCSLFEKRATGLYHNTAVVLEKDGRIAGKYRKMHIPDDPGYYEKYYFTPGDLGFTPIQTSVGLLGVLVCWDQWYPEAARLMALAGAELLLYPTAIGWNPDDTPEEQARQRDAWITIQRAHAIANNLPVLSCNRVGFETAPTAQGSGSQFWGSSMICGGQGEFLAQADTQQDQVLVVELDMNRTETLRRWWPYFRDRRIDAYTELNKRYRD
ncbi:carbon-nitrogen hydrolase [Thiolinea disciformis]|uniref:carbon-nitrogen hydrolase n=1 Tax=Thiolinea disciformis TaxID=125614 RepID=UPI00047633FD|nr:carbon-nitrogen hydrolase [Thiolinea disciformis]